MFESKCKKYEPKKKVVFCFSSVGLKREEFKRCRIILQLDSPKFAIDVKIEKSIYLPPVLSGCRSAADDI